MNIEIRTSSDLENAFKKEYDSFVITGLLAEKLEPFTQIKDLRCFDINIDMTSSELSAALIGYVSLPLPAIMDIVNTIGVFSIVNFLCYYKIDKADNTNRLIKLHKNNTI